MILVSIDPLMFSRFITEQRFQLLAGVISFPSKLEINLKYNKFGIFPMSCHFIATS